MVFYKHDCRTFPKGKSILQKKAIIQTALHGNNAVILHFIYACCNQWGHKTNSLTLPMSMILLKINVEAIYSSLWVWP